MFSWAFLALGPLALAGQAIPAAAAEPPGRHRARPDVCSFATPDNGQALSAAQMAVREKHGKSALLRAYDIGCDGDIAKAAAEAERDGYRKLLPAQTARGAMVPAAADTLVVKKEKPPKAKTAAANGVEEPLPLPKLCPQGWSGGYLFLRDSYDDIRYVAATDCDAPDLSKVKGAQFSWSHNGITSNDIWSAKGVAGTRFIYLQTGANNVDPYLNLFAIAPVVRFQRVINSNSKLTGNDIDILSPGISSEALFNQIFSDPQLQVYVRVRANANGTFDGDVNSWSGTVELQPIYDPLRIGTNTVVGNIFWSVSPLLRAQYFARNGGKSDPLFASSDQVFRAGPAVALAVGPITPDPKTPPPWGFTASYSEYRDFDHERTFPHFDATLTYNLTKNHGVTLSYEKGKIEETAKSVDLTTIAFTVKY